MQHTETSHEHTPEASADAIEPVIGHQRLGLFHWRYVLVYLILASLVLLAILPPLVNVSRFKRRIVTSISTSIGRPVHLDNVSLVLLPFPAFKLENFVVAEDPAFGAEPVIHANNVVATLRFSSLWRRKVEFSKISLQEPSINLVHMPAAGSNPGRWNVESILLQAARIPAAPTAQAKAGPDPRFPYIEATGARVNIKYGDEKLPLSLTEADFALWLPRPQQWRIRLEGKPARTDISASDTGTVSLEGTLGSAERFNIIPIDLSGEWKNAPLGEASRIVTGHDAGLRGDLRLNVSAHGTVGSSLVKASLQLRGARRAEFVPPQSLDLRAECQATAAETFHAIHEIRCAWPPPSAPSKLALTADLIDIHNPAAAPFELGTPGLPAATLLDWLRVASPRVSPAVTATGILTGSITRESVAEPGKDSLNGRRPDRSDSNGLSGHLTLQSASLTGGPIGETPMTLGDAIIVSANLAEPATRSQNTKHHTRVHASAEVSEGRFIMLPTTLALGGKEPATLEGQFDRYGYSLHLTGNVLPSRLLALASAIPQFGDGIQVVLPPPSSAGQTKELPLHIDIISTRVWWQGQSWAKVTTKQSRSDGPVRR